MECTYEESPEIVCDHCEDTGYIDVPAEDGTTVLLRCEHCDAYIADWRVSA